MVEPLSNGLLASLSALDLDALRPLRKTVELPQGLVLFRTGDLMESVYFPFAGVISLVVDFEAGHTIEVATLGTESLVGGSTVFASKISYNRAIVSVGGSAFVMDAHRLRALAAESKSFRQVLALHEELLLAQAQQTAACNILHPIDARLSRWLLRCRDLTGSDELPLTQEFLGVLLGVKRSSLSLSASKLHERGFISYRRGHIHVANREGLEQSACECYAKLKANSARLLGKGSIRKNRRRR